jgi:very-short-patch-repair endonuclease
VLRARLEHYDESESGLEVRVLRAIVGAGLPEPVQQHWVHVGGRRRRIDLAYPDLKLAIEVDGWGTHNSRSSFDGDRARENDLDIAGWHRLHFTSSFTDRQIAETVARKLAALGRKLSL